MITVSDEQVSDVAAAIVRLNRNFITSRHCCTRCAKLLLVQAMDVDREIQVIKAVDNADCFFLL